jgi:predicted O-linked N-acetylglucosamine transferase (SPINDLY family)
MFIPQTAEPPLDAVLSEAVSRHEAGDLEAAEVLYRRILAANPGHADASHNLGLIAFQTGHAGDALTHFQAALEADPRQRQFWLSCIGALLQLGDHRAAGEVLAQARRCGLSGPDSDALAARVAELSAADEMRPAGKASPPERERRRKPARKAAELPPSQAAELMKFMSQKRHKAAETRARELALRYPANGFVWKVLGAALQEQGRRGEALRIKEHAAALLPEDPEIQNNLGNALLKLQRLEEAEARYRRAIELRPAYPEPWCSLGLVLQKRGLLDRAEEPCRRALSLRPVYPDASSNLGMVLQSRGLFQEAEACYRTALAADPAHHYAWSNLGTALQKQDRLDEAASAYARSFELAPDYAEALANLAGCLHQMGYPEEAEAAHRRAVGIEDKDTSIHSNFLFFLLHRQEIGPEALFAEHLAFGARFEAPLRSAWRPHANLRDPERPLRVGLISADFQQHAMASFIEPLLAGLAPDASLSLHAYANQTADDPVTRRLRGYFRRWTRVYGLSDPARADRIRADGIDILIDLCGHTGGGSPGTLAHRPAPVQCGWIGYLGTSGMRSVDHYLADPVFLPPGEFDRQFTEKIAYLPVVSPFRPIDAAPPVGPLPALTNGHITFGSFSRMGKLSPPVVALWSELLRAAPGSRMLLGGMRRDGGNDRLLAWFAAEGVPRERLQFHPSAGMDAYLALHLEVDICLDPFPFTGATTTCHAMWMGVPTLTLAGNTPPGRLGAALLRHAGLDDFVASDAADYLSKGLRWANDPRALARLRGGMRARVAGSPLLRPEEFGRELSALLRRLWKDWCARAV